MREEIPFHEGKIVFFKESNFWDELLIRVSGDTDIIYIATYNFNFNSEFIKYWSGCSVSICNYD